MSQFEADPRSRSCQKELTPSHVNIHRPSLSIYLPSILHPLILLPYRVLLLRCNLTCLNSATYYQHIEPVTRTIRLSAHPAKPTTSQSILKKGLGRAHVPAGTHCSTTALPPSEVWRQRAVSVCLTPGGSAPAYGPVKGRLNG
eukprot:4657753-Pyramimonas_sp.AAC.1